MLINDLSSILLSEEGVVNVTRTQIQQFELLYPEKPNNIKIAIEKCNMIIYNSLKSQKILKKDINYLLLAKDIKNIIRQTTIKVSVEE